MRLVSVSNNGHALWHMVCNALQQLPCLWTKPSGKYALWVKKGLDVVSPAESCISVP